jgi:hypothetical protein
MTVMERADRFRDAPAVAHAATAGAVGRDAARPAARTAPA